MDQQHFYPRKTFLFSATPLLPYWKALLNITVKPDVLLRATLQCCPHNIAILIGRLLWAICKQLKLIASWNWQTICKQSLWLDYKKKGRSNPVAQTIWLASFLVSPIRDFVYKSFVNFNLQFVWVACKLLRPICLSKLQYCGTILLAIEHPVWL